VRVPGAGTLRELLDLTAPIAMQAFDKDRPLWELYHVEGMTGGRHAIVMKLHHSVSDGVGLVRMTSSLVERSREPDPRHREQSRSLGEDLAEVGPRSPFEETLQALRFRAGENMDRTSRLMSALGRGLGDLARDPLGAATSARDVAGSLGRMLRPVSEPMSSLMTGRSLRVRFDTISLSLEELKRAGKEAGGTLNDAFVAAMVGGLRLYHDHHGQPTDELRMTMPINIRKGEKGKQAGNQFVPARFTVPVAIADPVERMQEIRRRVASQRGEPSLPLFEEISGMLSRLPRSLSVSLFGSMLKAIDFVTSNVPGPPFPVFASGALVEHMVGFGPLSGAAVNITLFSYDGELQIGINTDRAAVPDPEVFVESLQRGVDEVLSVA
jgi:WS/DGAT/MGAT family acyltransferase